MGRRAIEELIGPVVLLALVGVVGSMGFEIGRASCRERVYGLV